MTTETKKKKNFDAVELQRRLREDLSKRIQGMTPEQKIKYFEKASEEFNQKKSTGRRTSNWNE